MNRQKIMLWEKKIQLKEEARSEFQKQNEELQKLKMEVQNKEVRSVYGSPQGLERPEPHRSGRRRTKLIGEKTVTQTHL